MADDQSVLIRVMPEHPDYRRFADPLSRQEASYKLHRFAKSASSPVQPMELLPVPDIVQPNDFWCDVCCTYAVCQMFGVPPESLEACAKDLGTTREDSTKPDRIVSYLRERGLEAEPRELMTIEDLEESWRKGNPVMVLCQAYGVETKAQPYGHCVVFKGMAFDRLFLMDPSIDNVLQGDDAPNDPGEVVITAERWMKRWWEERDGKRYERFGIVVSKPVEPQRFAKIAHDGAIRIEKA
jgi:hypothetical protein